MPRVRMRQLEVETFLGRGPLILLGAGQLTRMAMELWPEKLPLPALILAASGPDTIRGIPVKHPKDHQPNRDNVYVLSYFKDAASRVRRSFREDFRQEIITIYDILTCYSPDLFSNGWQGDPDKYEEVLELASYFDDEESKNVFDAATQWRYRRILRDDYPLIPEGEKYRVIPATGNHSAVFDHVVDGGAYDLSLANSLVDQGLLWKSYVAVEPDPSRGPYLGRAREDLPEELRDRVRIDSRALSHSSGIAPFHGNGLMSARLAGGENAGTVPVVTIRLEDLLTQNGVSSTDKCLLKLHLEGAEWPVLESSQSFLEQAERAHVLINLSHDEESLLRIPPLLASLGYRLNLSSYALFGEGLTLAGQRY